MNVEYVTYLSVTSNSMCFLEDGSEGGMDCGVHLDDNPPALQIEPPIGNIFTKQAIVER